MNDDDLRARLRAADPARHLTDSRHLDLTEAAMSTTPTPGSTGPRPGSARLVLAAAAAAVVVLAAVAVVAGTDDDPAPEAGPSKGASQSTTPSAEPTADSTAATYVLVGGPAGRCIPPNPEGIAALDTAFKGTVVSVSDTRIVVEPSEYYSGNPADQVVLRTRKGVNRELLPVRFREDESYVFAVERGEIQLCGYTAEASPELEKRYTEALAR